MNTTRLTRLLQAAACLCGLLLSQLVPAAEVKDGYFTTCDGVRLHYLEAGAGKPLGMIPGWGQAARRPLSSSTTPGGWATAPASSRSTGAAMASQPSRTTATASTACPR